jgi:hypothetical protein
MTEFKPGQSGNSSGRPKGALNKATLATQGLTVRPINPDAAYIATIKLIIYFLIYN